MGWHGDRHGHMRRAPRALLQLAAVAAAVAAGSACPALAEPAVVITSPLDGSVSNDATPVFTGTAQSGGGQVTLSVFRGAAAEGAPVDELHTSFFLFGEWSLGPVEPLADGIYTAQATQTNYAMETQASAPVTFTVQTAAPRVTLDSPPSPSDDATPSFSGTASDTTPVLVEIHAGTSPSGGVISSAQAAGNGAGWSSQPASPPLVAGTYTAVAVQQSSVPGNPAGSSEPVTFTLIAAPSTPANAAGAGAGQAPTPQSAPPPPQQPPTLMEPFPVVQIAGSYGARGARIGLLTVLAPAGSSVRVTCRGGGCPKRSQRVLASPHAGSDAASVLIAFPRFERALRAGAVLEVWISRAGEIGKLTRVRVRRSRPPSRTDTCSNPQGTAPLACPL